MRLNKRVWKRMQKKRKVYGKDTHRWIGKGKVISLIKIQWWHQLVSESSENEPGHWIPNVESNDCVCVCAAAAAIEARIVGSSK